MKDILKKALLLVLSGIIGGFIGIALYSSFIDNSNGTNNSDVPGKLTNYTVEKVELPTFDFSYIADKISPTVVHIKTKVEVAQQDMGIPKNHPFYEFFQPFEGYNAPRMGSGSGVIISDNGYIVTNNHVIDNADEIEVSLHDKRSFDAEVIGRDPQTDLAVIKIDAEDLPFLKYGNSDDLKVGEWVLAIGNPFNLTSTVTAGIVSAKARNINLLNKEYSIESFIQTDAAVNPGNSGGALVNIKGELVGINTAIASRSGAYEGYAFAVPANLVTKVVDDIMEYGKVQRGYLGIRIGEVTEEIADEAKLDKIQGVYVHSVMENSAAEEAGLKGGDIITKINDKEVNSSPELQELVSRNRPGDDISVTYMRKGKEYETKAKLKDQKGNTEIIDVEESEVEDMLEADFEELSYKELRELGISNGVKVVKLYNGKFKAAGIPKGFIITKIDKQKVESIDDIYTILKNASDGILIEGINPDGSKGYYGLGIN